MRGLNIIASSQCPPGTVYVFSQPPQRDMFDSEDDYAAAVDHWQQHGVHAVKAIGTEVPEEALAKAARLKP